MSRRFSMAPKRKREAKPAATRVTSELRARQKSRDNVGRMALGMHEEGEVALTYMIQASQTLKPCDVVLFSLYELMEFFVKGKLNLDPNGQRNSTVSRAYVRAFAQTILKTSLGIPSIILNKLEDGMYDVVDGKQRIASMIALASGLVPALGTSYLFTAESQPEWHYAALLERPEPHIVATIATIQTLVGAPRDDDPIHTFGDPSIKARFTTVKLVAQVYPAWPASALAAASAIYCVKTLAHTPDEILFQLDNPLCDALRAYEADTTSVLATLCGKRPAAKPDNTHKAVFGDMLRGIACAFPGIDYVPKGNNAIGYGNFLDNLVPLVAEPMDDETKKTLKRACTSRLARFVTYAREHTIVFKSFKPDMIAMLFFMLYSNFEPEGICDTLFVLSEPKRRGNDETAVEWLIKTYRKKQNMREAFQAYLDTALNAPTDAVHDDADA